MGTESGIHWSWIFLAVGATIALIAWILTVDDSSSDSEERRRLGEGKKCLRCGQICVLDTDIVGVGGPVWISSLRCACKGNLVPQIEEEVNHG